MTVGLQKSRYQPDSTCHNLFSKTNRFFIKRGNKGIQAIPARHNYSKYSLHHTSHSLFLLIHIRFLREWWNWFSPQLELGLEQWETNKKCHFHLTWKLWLNHVDSHVSHVDQNVPAVKVHTNVFPQAYFKISQGNYMANCILELQLQSNFTRFDPKLQNLMHGQALGVEARVAPKEM